ncbi:proteasome subunit alpha, partial [Streptomyces sp. NPDC057927]
VAVLDRTRPQQRKFRRIVGRQLGRLLEEGGAETATEAEDAEDEE